MRVEDRLGLATSVSLAVPIAYMIVLWLVGMQAFSPLLAAWFLADALLQFGLIYSVRKERLSRQRFSTLWYASALVFGLPATVLAVYSGLAAEFRIVPLMFVLMQRRQLGRAVTALVIFFTGVLLLFPLFPGRPAFLVVELFRPLAVVSLLFLLRPIQKKARLGFRQQVVRLRSRFRTTDRDQSSVKLVD